MSGFAWGWTVRNFWRTCGLCDLKKGIMFDHKEPSTLYLENGNVSTLLMHVRNILASDHPNFKNIVPPPLHYQYYTHSPKLSGCSVAAGPVAKIMTLLHCPQWTDAKARLIERLSKKENSRVCCMVISTELFVTAETVSRNQEIKIFNYQPY